MSLSYKVFSAGVSTLEATAAWKDISASLTATGTLQSDALMLTNAVNFVGTVAASTGVILDSQISAGDYQYVYNAGANTLKVYPPLGAKINALATNTAFSLCVGIGIIFKCYSATQIIMFGSMSAQDASNVSITGGSITGITDLLVADGGTGASSFTAYAVICGGTTSTNPLQSIAGVGNSGQVLTSNGAATLPTFQAASGGITLGTPTATTSGTSVTYSGLATGLKEIVVSFNSVSTNGVSSYIVQIGPSGGVEISGYVGAVGDRAAETFFNTGFNFNRVGVAARNYSGHMLLRLMDSANNIWSCATNCGPDSVSSPQNGGGQKPLAGVLSIVKITTVNGTDTFDNGSVNISYQ